MTTGYPDPFKDDGRGTSASSKMPPPVAPKPITSKSAQKIITPTSGIAPANKFTPSAQSHNVLVPPILPKPTMKTESHSQNISSKISPPDSPTQSSSKHRRNVSDTSAFNK